MIPKECKRLAEVDFPIAEVSRHAAREKSIRHGHPSTLHLWWAQAPAGIIPGRADGPAATRPLRPPLPRGVQGQGQGNPPGDAWASIRVGLHGQDRRRAPASTAQVHRRFRQLGQLRQVGVLGSRTRVGQSRPSRADSPGGGPLRRRRLHPLEALRLGCDAFASDLNPVACLILKVMLEDIPRHGPGLADELRKAGAEIKAQGREGDGRPLSQGPGRSDAHRLPLGPHRPLRGPQLRSRDPPDAVHVAVPEAQAEMGTTPQCGTG